MVTKKINIGFIIDPLASLNLKKDSSLAMMKTCQNKGYGVFVFEPHQLFTLGGRALGQGRQIFIDQTKQPFFEVLREDKIDLSELDLIMMRKDPPFNLEYIYATHILEAAHVRVSNPPRVLRWFNEKACLPLFPDLIPPTCMTKKISVLKTFIKAHHKVVVKPLNGMGGAGIFMIESGSPNENVILETMTQNQTQTVMAQKYIPEIKDGDHRIMVFFGEPFSHVLVRMPSKGDHRGNLAAGGSHKVQPISDVQKDICMQLTPFFKKYQLDLVGLDIIGKHVTEINITSPTCFREISEGTRVDLVEIFMNGFDLSPS